MIGKGIKASELIKHLRDLKRLHGDCRVIAGGEDYPGGVQAVSFVTEKDKDCYTPSGTFRIIS